MSQTAVTIADQIEDQAQVWIKATFSDPEGKRYWQNRFSAENMETAFIAGASAGIELAQKMVKGAR